MKGPWDNAINHDLWHLAGSLLLWIGGIAVAILLLVLAIWLFVKFVRNFGPICRGIGRGVKKLGSTVGSVAAAGSKGTSGLKSGASRLLGVIYALWGVALVYLVGVDPFRGFARGAAWGWLALTLLATAWVVYYGLGTRKSWSTKIIGPLATSFAIVVIASGVRSLSGSTFAGPLVPTVLAHDSGGPVTPRPIPTQLGESTVEWNHAVLCIPPHSTIEVRATGEVNYDPDGSRQQQLANRYRQLLAEGEYRRAEKFAIYQNKPPGTAFRVTPDYGATMPSLWEERAKAFPLPDSPFGRPYLHPEGRSPIPLTSRWVELTNPGNLPMEIRVGLNIDPCIVCLTSLKWFVWRNPDQFTLEIRGLQLPV